MNLIEFRYWMFILADFIYVLPFFFFFTIPLALKKELKWFFLYFLFYLLVNLSSYIVVLYLRLSNFYFGYFYTFIDLVFGFLFMYEITKNKMYKKQIITLELVGGLVFVIDLFFLTGFHNRENFPSQIIISLILCFLLVLSIIRYLQGNFIVPIFNATEPIVLMSFFIKYFIKSIYGFFNSFLYDSESNYYITSQLDNFANLCTVFSVIISAYFLYLLKKHHSTNLHV
jgi:hypothetical protein